MRRAWTPLLLVCALALVGCIDRRVMIRSDPSGALVTLNDVEVGRTPVEVSFTHHGVYDVRLRKEGYEPLLTSARTDAMWWEAPGIDILATAWPGARIRRIEWSFTLEPVDRDPARALARARAFRGEMAAQVDLRGEDDATPRGEPLVIPPGEPGGRDPRPTPEEDLGPLTPDPNPGVPRRPGPKPARPN